ncbi:Uncharacterised protein [Mycobacteroides abscessus subsp. abscessus]|nr:Uncharacterised protein [Mycobacteroides abscessus subsp. abscessus]
MRRRSFGSDLMSAVISSSRKAGTCQANSSPPRRARTSTGMCTDTPSSAAPGSNRYVTGSATSPARQVSGISAPASAVRSSSSRVKVSRFGVLWRCLRHHASKCLADTASAGMRAA